MLPRGKRSRDKSPRGKLRDDVIHRERPKPARVQHLSPPSFGRPSGCIHVTMVMRKCGISRFRMLVFFSGTSGSAHQRFQEPGDCSKIQSRIGDSAILRMARGCPCARRPMHGAHKRRCKWSSLWVPSAASCIEKPSEMLNSDQMAKGQPIKALYYMFIPKFHFM